MLVRWDDFIRPTRAQAQREKRKADANLGPPSW